VLIDRFTTEFVTKQGQKMALLKGRFGHKNKAMRYLADSQTHTIRPLFLDNWNDNTHAQTCYSQLHGCA